MNERDRLRSVRAGREELAPGLDRPRHQHFEPYAIVVLRGCFEQTSYAGRVRVVAGDLLVQPTLDCHANRMCSAGAQILRLPWHDVDGLGGVYPLADVDAIARAAERDLVEAAALARAAARAARPGARDWPDQLATELATGRTRALAVWAEHAGVARETVSRGFAAAYGVSAQQFRGEVRAREAWLAIVRTRAALATIAAATGFADQSHMTRAVRTLTGATPDAWRRHHRATRFRRA